MIFELNMRSLVYSEIISRLDKNKIQYSSLKSLATDASNRKYFLISQNGLSHVLMYDDGPKENISKFLDITKTFSDFSLSVPRIISSYENDGILIIENFGSNKYSEILNKKNKEKLYKVAIDSLIHLHQFPANKKLKNYSNENYLEESFLFFDWYLKYKKKKFNNSTKEEFKNLLLEHLKIIDLLPRVYVHRDFHIDNLFFLSDRNGFKQCGWIDYQDALIGCPAYDIMSLLEDARLDVDQNIAQQLTDYYVKKSKNINLKIFLISFQVIAIQRHLKVLGIFARLSLRDKKETYSRHFPRILRMIRKNLANERFKNLRTLLDGFL